MNEIKTKSITIRAAEGRVHCVKINEDGDLLFTGGSTAYLTAWEVKTGKRLGTYIVAPNNPFSQQAALDSLINPPTAAIKYIDVKRDSSEVAITHSYSIIIFEVLTGAVLDYIPYVTNINDIEFNQSPIKIDKFLVGVSARVRNSADQVPEVCMWQCSDLHPENYGKSNRDWKLVKNYSTEGEIPAVVRWGPLDQLVICGTEHGTIFMWDIEGNIVHKLKAHSDEITDISFNKDRSVMLTVSRDKTAKLWNTVELRLIKTYVTDRPLNTGCISPDFDKTDDDRRFHIILAGGQDAKEVTTSSTDQGFFETLILDLISGQELARITAHFSPILTLRYLMNGKGFVTGSYEGNCKIIELPNSFFAGELVI